MLMFALHDKENANRDVIIKINVSAIFIFRSEIENVGPEDGEGASFPVPTPFFLSLFACY